MAPANTKPREEEEDLDDLDDLLDEFNPDPKASTSSATTSSQKPSSSSSSAPSTSTSASSATAAATDDDFPDPESPTLSGSDIDEEEFAKELQEGMKQLLSQFGDGDDGQELQKMMQDLMKGGGMDDSFLSALGAGAGAAGPSTGAGSKAAKKSPSSLPPQRAPPTNFQDTLSQTINKLGDSKSTIDSQTAASTSAAASQDPLMAAMLAQLGGMEGLEGLDALGADGENGIQGVLDQMMDQLMSRELLYTPLKELGSKYPGYLSENATKLSAKDLARFKQQQVYVDQIVALFEEPGADKTENLTKEEEVAHKERQKKVTDLVKEMNDCGAPPTEIMGEIPDDLELGPDGVPKLPADCIIS